MSRLKIELCSVLFFKIISLMLFSQSVRELMGDWKERSVNRPRREWIPSDKSLGGITKFFQIFEIQPLWILVSNWHKISECSIILNWKAHILGFYLKKCQFWLKMCAFYTIEKQTKSATHLWKSHQCAPRRTLLDTLDTWFEDS